MKAFNSPKSMLLGGSLLALLFEPAIAAANDEIIVTARRKAENLQDVPGSITALTAETLAKSGVQRVEDFIGLTPGVTLVNAAEAGDTQVNIRGINGARDAENSFAFLIDGILYTNPAAFNREYTNLQQIEVFKGPQGAIYGRNAAAGAIIVTTETPGNELSANATLSYAEDETVLVKGAISGPLVKDELFFRIGGDWRSTDGFYRNDFLGGSPTIDAFESYNINGRLVYQPNDKLSVDVKARYGEIDANSIVFNANFHLPAFAGANNVPAANQDVNDHPFIFQPNVTSDNDQEAFEVSGKVDYELDDVTITAWALYSDIDNNLIADGTSAAFGFYAGDPVCQQTVADFNAQGFQLPSPEFFGQNPGGVIFDPNGSFLGAYTPSTCDGIQEQLRDQSDFSAEIRIASNGDGPLGWMLGGYFLDIDRQVGVSLNRDGGGPVTRGLLQLSGENRTDALAFDDFDSRVYAVFGSADYALTDDIELSAALRYDREEREVSSLVPTDARQSIIDLDFDTVFDDPLNPGLSSIVNPAGVIPDQSETFEQVQPKISGTYDVVDGTTLFASWGIGFKAGGFNNSGSAATVNLFNNGLIRDDNSLTGVDFAALLGSDLPVIEDNYDKEKSSAFEAGFKSTLLDGRLRVSGAGYYTDVTDMQFFEFFVGNFGLLRVVSNIDEVEIFGFEIGAEADVTDFLNLYAGFNYTESEIKANSSRPDTVGNKSPYTPDYTVNFGGDVTLPVVNDIEFLLRADAQVIGPTWFHTVQGGDRATIFNPLFELGFGAGAGALGTGNFVNAQRDSYVTLDLRAGLQTDTWSLTVFANNVTDTNYLEEVIPAPEFGGSFLAPGAERRIGVEAGMKF
ncbi:MAG: TonB-dependent receptor [Pseudomonadota bacterium]